MRYLVKEEACNMAEFSTDLRGDFEGRGGRSARLDMPFNPLIKLREEEKAEGMDLGQGWTH